MTDGRRLRVGAVVGMALLSAVVSAGAAQQPATAAGSAPTGMGAPGTVQLFAGIGNRNAPAGDGGLAAAAGLRYPTGLAHDAAGDVLIATDAGIRRVDAATGSITTLRGRLTPGGPLVPGVRYPQQIAVDHAGNVYAAEGQTLTQITPGGSIVHAAGAGSPWDPGQAGSTGVLGVAVDPAGNVFFTGRGPAVYKLTPGRVLTRIAGGHDQGYAGDGGPAVDASFVRPTSLAVAPDGALYVADNEVIRRIGPDGIITTVVGGGLDGCEGAPARAAGLADGMLITVDPQGRLLIAETYYHHVLRLEADGTLSTVLGQGPVETLEPGPVRFGAPGPLSTVAGLWGVDVLPDGRVLAASFYGSQVLAVTPGAASGVARVLAGNGTPGRAGTAGDGGAACGASLAYPTSIARAGDGSTYVADYLNSQIRRITPDGRISTVAGTGLPGFSGDGGPAKAARLDRPRAVAVDPAGRVLIADVVNNRIRRLDPTTGTITTIAGTGAWGNSGDGGPATSARLAGPHSVAVSGDGTVWVADTGNHTVRRIGPDGTISAAAGTGTAGSAGDGGPATAAQLTSPRAVAVDTQALYLSDPGTRSVRRVDLATGVISTLAGPATGTPLSNPASLLPTPAGLLVADAGSNRILRLSPTGSTVTVVAGTGSGSTGYGTPTWAAHRPTQLPLAQPQGLTAAPDGTLLVADTGHHQVLQISP